MKLAFVSYEYPPDTAFGGIGTYIYMISRAMRRMGHQVEVFCASTERESLHENFEEGVIAHRVKCARRRNFPQAIAPVFAARHQQVNFDLLESPEFDADGHVIRSQFPGLPLVVKFHTPKFLVKELNNAAGKRSLKQVCRELLAPSYQKEKDKEYRLAMSADALTSPSLSLKQIVSERWNISSDRILHSPYVYLPNEAFLDIPICTNTRTVTFTGRLETRKGVLALAMAIPLVMQQHPDVRFRFVGKPDKARNGQRMDVYLKELLSAVASHIQFIPRVPPAQIPVLLAETDICVYPSLWENFPFVCLEAMAAGRGIVASKKGGMVDMLADIEGGMLVDPQSPREIADAIIHLLSFPEKRMAMGERCRKKIVDYYNGRLMPEVSALYERIAAGADQILR